MQTFKIHTNHIFVVGDCYFLVDFSKVLLYNN